MDLVARRRRSLANQVKTYSCNIPRYILQTESLQNFGFGDLTITKRRVKSLSEIYAPVTFLSNPTQKEQTRKRKRRRKLSATKNLQLPSNLSNDCVQKPSIPELHSLIKGSGDWHQGSSKTHLRRKYRNCTPSGDYFEENTLVRKMAEIEQEAQNIDEPVPEEENIEITENEDDQTPIAPVEEDLQEETAPTHESIDEAVVEQNNDSVKEAPADGESPGETEVDGADEERKTSVVLEVQNERKSIAGDRQSMQKRESTRKSCIKREPSVCSDLIFARPSVMNELNDTYQRLFETKAQVDDLKRSIEKYKDASYTEEDAKELKEKEKQLFEKLSELENVTQKLVELGGIPMPECDFSTLPPDMCPEIMPSEDKYFDELKKCIDMPDMGLGFEKPKLDMRCGYKGLRKPSMFSPASFRLSQNVPEVSSFLSTAFELPKVIMCRTGQNLPKIIVGDTKKKLNIMEGKPGWPYPKIDESMDPKNEVVICLTDRLKESYNIQDKLVSENVHMEDFQYQLQEEIIAKEQALEDLKRKNNQIQSEMKLLLWENKQLQDKLCQKQQIKQTCRRDQAKKVEENLMSRLEMQVKSLEKDLHCVQMARKQAETERCKLQEAAASMKYRPTTSPPQFNQDKNCEKIMQLKEKYARVTDDYRSKVTEVAALHVENENLIIEVEEKKRCLKEAENTIKELQDKLMAAEMERGKGPKGQSSQLMVLEQQLRDAKDELEELHMRQQECTYQEEYYREKYLLAQQQVEEQRRQIELMEADNKRITKQVEEEIQRVKCQFQEKLEELKSLPDTLRITQCRLQETLQKNKAAEEKNYELKLELEDARAKMHEATQKLDQFWNQQQDAINQYDGLTAKVEAWEKKCKDLQECNCKLKQEMKRLEDCASQCRRCAEEKSMEILQLSNQLECVREDSARQVAKAKERCETVRRSYQAQIEDLERQLAQTRASARAAQAERDETRKRMQCEIANLSENFEQAQSRIRYLQSHVNYLKRSFSNQMLDQSSDNMMPADTGDYCSCD